MKVGYITASISRQAGGLKDSVRWEAKALRDCGTDVEVFAAEDSDSASDLPGWEPLRVKLSIGVGPARFSYAPGLSQLLAEAELDVLASHGLWRYTSILTSKWHAQTHRPYIVSPHGMLDPWALQNSRVRKRAAALLFEDRHLSQASCIRALCAPEGEAIRGYGLTNPVAIIPNGVDLPDLALSTARPWDGIEGFAGAKVLLSIGRLHPKKNLIALLSAWKQVLVAGSREINEWRLVIGGWDDGGYAEQLKQCVREMGLTKTVWLAGPFFGENKDAAFRSASAFVLPSLSEGLPMVVLEAWSYGLPVLMTAECNLPEGFDNGAAIAIEPSVAGIGEGVGKLLALDNAERIAMGRRGRELCAQRFDWSHVARQMKDLLNWIRGGGARPDFVS
jgi:glycosyltransferase involved in cell wall biosynthesis